MDNSQKKFAILTTSIVLHAITLFVIFVLYHQPAHDLADFDPSHAIDVTETVFYDPPSAQNSTPYQTPDDQSWGQLKPRASTLGGSMEMPDGPIGPEMAGDPSESSDESSDSESSENDEQTARENSLEFSSQIKFDASTQPTLDDIGPARPELVEGSERLEDASTGSARTDTKSDINSRKSSSSTAKAVSKARKALASITQGYLQQLKDEGENLIKTIGGDPNKKPTAEQLKYERYLAKIQWCLQNAHSINQEKCQLQEPIDTVMRIYFVLNKEGKMSGFKIMQSSGKAYVDQYISSLFQFASSSFPPLPAYIKEDHLPLTYTVMVNWNTGSSMGFSRY